MANQWYQLTYRQRVNGVEVANVFDYLVRDPSVQNNTGALALKFSNDVGPLLRAFQFEQIEGIDIYVVNRSDARFSYTLPYTGPGDLLTVDTQLPVQTLCLYTRLLVGNTFSFIGEVQETARPIRRGKKYWAGVSESAVTSFGLDTAWQLAARDALRAQLAVTLILPSTDEFIPIVHGWALPLTPEKPARPEVFAEIEDAADVSITNLGSRKR